MDLTSFKALQDIGVVGVLGIAVYFLLKYVNKKDDTIKDLIDINQEQNNQMKETNNLLKELTEHQKDCREYSKFGYWWIFNHQPTPEICENCDEYETCPHPRKIIIKRKK